MKILSRVKEAFLTRLSELVKSRKTETVILLSMAGYLVSLGLLTGTVVNPNYELMYEFASRYFWAALFFVYATIKAYSLFLPVNIRLKLVNGMIGLWAWVYIFLSFTVFDKTPMAPTETLLAIPVITQSWLTLATVYWSKNDNK